jgi:hypothetical protein
MKCTRWWGGEERGRRDEMKCTRTVVDKLALGHSTVTIDDDGVRCISHD